MKDVASCLDHTLLRPDATRGAIEILCEEAVEFGCASVCVPPLHVGLASDRLYGSGVAVCTVVGFPCGYNSTDTKIFEAERAIAAGASEVDMVISLGAAREGLYEIVEEDIRGVTGAVPNAVVKVIIECALFDESVKRRLVECVVAGGAHYVKTSTGFGPGGATVEDVKLLVAASNGRIAVKAAGGIRDWKAVQSFLDAGATRIGTSSSAHILEEWRGQLP